jgi:hypothetical protein
MFYFEQWTRIETSQFRQTQRPSQRRRRRRQSNRETKTRFLFFLYFASSSPLVPLFFFWSWGGVKGKALSLFSNLFLLLWRLCLKPRQLVFIFCFFLCFCLCLRSFLCILVFTSLFFISLCLFFLSFCLCLCHR